MTGLQEANSISEIRVAWLYLSAEEDPQTPDLLFFEEQIIHEPGWKKASDKGRELWQRLKQRYERVACEAFAGDRFVRRLRSFRKVTVALNRPIDPAEVRMKLKRMLRDRSYHHLRWLFIDLALLPLSLFIMVVPGPNVIGYYLLFRVFSHWKSYRSASQTDMDQVDICIDDRAQEVSAFLRKAKDLKTGLLELREKYGLRALQEHQFVPQSMQRLLHLLRTDH
ncbi:mitochondrial K+-H+ exchange-related family protein [bacterium]|nr:mitochondrial K+-H+ exchange-related family protein [bacterium]MCI0605041.1 mitochondrial K+-H+ exchange-related family protein [bacterium]